MTLSRPALCQRCLDETGEFTMPYHPDDGMKFLCSIMMENIREGCMSFSCPYFRPKPVAPIIDAEERQRVLRVIQSIKEEPVPGYVAPSPHAYLDSLMTDKNVDRAFDRVETDIKIAKAENQEDF
jgi:hypothetical protein